MLVERPAVAPYVPAGHAVALVDAAAQKLPCGHVVQPDGLPPDDRERFAAAPYVPAGHAVAALDPAGQKKPGGHAAPTETPAVAHSLPAGQGLAVAAVLPVPTQKPAAHAVAAGADVDEPAGHQWPAAHRPPHAASTLVCPAVAPNDPAGHSAHVVAPAAAENEPAGHATHEEPLRKEPAWQTAVPAIVAPPDKSVHDDEPVDDADAPSAKQRKLVGGRLSNCVGGFGVNVYDVAAAESAPAGDLVAADHVGEPAIE